MTTKHSKRHQEVGILIDRDRKYEPADRAAAVAHAGAAWTADEGADTGRAGALVVTLHSRGTSDAYSYLAYIILE